MRYCFLFLLFAFAPLSANAFSYNNNPADAALQQISSKDKKSLKNAMEVLIADEANRDYIIEQLIAKIEEISKPFAVYAQTRSEMNVLYRQYNIRHTLEPPLYIMSEIIKQRPEKANILAIFFNTQNHFMIHIGFELIKSLDETAGQKEVAVYIPQIKTHIIKAASYSPYARGEFLNDGLRALSEIGTPEAKRAMEEAERDFKDKEQIQLGVEASNNESLKITDPELWKQRQYEMIGQHMKMLVGALNIYYGRYGNKLPKAPTLEVLLNEKYIPHLPSTQLEGLAYWVGEYSAHGQTRYMIVVGQKTQDGIPDGAAFTVNEASAIYHAARMKTLYLANARGHNDCVNGRQYNTNNPQKACILVGWPN